MGPWLNRTFFSLTAAVCAATVSANAAPFTSAVPFVGCAADGQTGPSSAPKKPAKMPRVVGSGASTLAYYASNELGVLAPRGWHCFGLYGSNGSVLIVTPEEHGQDLFNPLPGLGGSAVQLSLSVGDTSGRFEAAEVAARLFPSRKKFVEGVMAEGIEPRSSFHFGSFPTDTVRRYGDDVVEFETPANKSGMGTKSRLAPGGDPIKGLAMMTSENDLVMLVVRLPKDQRDLATTIMDSTRQAKRSSKAE
jgi:hypothetical protein